MDLSLRFLNPRFNSDLLFPPKHPWFEMFNSGTNSKPGCPPPVSVIACPAGEFSLQLPAYQRISSNLFWYLPDYPCGTLWCRCGYDLHQLHPWMANEDGANLSAYRILNGVDNINITCGRCCFVLLCAGEECEPSWRCTVSVSAIPLTCHSDKVHFYPAINPPIALFRGHFAKLS